MTCRVPRRAPVLVLTIAALLAPARAPASLVAVSLRAAERVAVASGHDDVLESAGTMRLIAAVVDPAADDVVLVGKPDRATGGSLEDVAMVLRALMRHGAAPLVSLENADGRTIARWAGGIERSGLGERLLAADFVLKRAALGVDAPDRFGFRSFFDGSVERAGAMFDVRNNFWFVAAPSNLIVVRENVVAAMRIDLVTMSRVTAVLDGTSATRDPAAEAFAAGMTASFGAMAGAYPELERLRAVFEIVAVVDALREMPAAAGALSYWLDTFAPSERRLDENLPHLERFAQVVGSSGQAHVLRVDGGIDTAGLARRLEDADVEALRTAVLLSRPADDTLRWVLPIERWGIATNSAPDTAVDRTAALFSTTVPGAVIERRLLRVGSNDFRLAPLVPAPVARRPSAAPVSDRGGISAQMDFDEADFQR